MEDLDYDEDLEDEDVKKEKEEAIGGELGFEGSNQLLRVDALFRAEGYDILVNILCVGTSLRIHSFHWSHIF